MVEVVSASEVIPLAFKIRNGFVEAARHPKTVPALNRLIDDRDALALDAVATARFWLSGKVGAVMPSVALISRSGMVAHITIPDLSDTADQCAIAAAFAAVIATSEVDAWWFVSEAWFSVVTPDTDPKIRDLSPRERADRKEVLFVSSGTIDYHSLRAFWIERDAAGRATGLPERTMDDHVRLHDPLAMDLFAGKRRR